MIVYIPEFCNPEVIYKTPETGIKYLYSTLDKLDETPLSDWTAEHLDSWTAHLCVYADQRIKNFKYERKRRWLMANCSEYARHRRLIKNSPAGRMRARAIRDKRLKYATPAWADHAKMQWFYDLASLMELLTGEAYHVDHIVPLIAKNERGDHIASGLHWEGNLTVVKASVNLKKGCIYIPQ